MYFFLHVLPEVVSAVFSFLVEWFLFQEQPALYGGTLSPLVTAWLYMAMMLAVWLLPIFYDACRRKGGMISTALNLLPAEIIFGGEFLYRLPLVGAAVRIFVLIASLLLLIPSLYGIHVLRADQARTVTAFYKTYYETDSSFLVDLEASGLLGSL